MAVQSPSQFQCDNMQPGDIIFVKHRNILYKWYRKHFTSKPLLKVRENWAQNTNYNYRYQEDCVLIYAYELQCIQIIENSIPCMIRLWYY